MNQPSNASEDYISLSRVKLFIIHVLRGFFGVFGLAGAVFKRRYYLPLAGILLGCLAGWFYSRLKGTYYQVSMVVEYRTLDKSIYMKIVDELNMLIRSGSSHQLAAELGISPELSARVLAIKTENMQGVLLSKDSTTGNRMFMIVALLRSPVGADSLDHGLLAYINGLPYVRAQMGEGLRIRQEQLIFIRREMDRLDSLKSEYARSLMAVKPGIMYYNNAFDPVSIYKQSYSLDSLQAAIRQDLVQGDRALAEITGFQAGMNPQSTPAWFYVVVLAAFGFFAAWLLAIALEIKKNTDVDPRTIDR